MTQTFTLSDGRKATVKTGKGYDLLQAQIKAKTSEEIPYALIAELTEIDGQPIVYEDILELPLEDVITLQGAVTGKSEKPKQDTKTPTNVQPFPTVKQ